MGAIGINRADVYQEITDQMIAMLEAGTRPWSQTWAGSPLSLPLRANGVPYRGINILVLWASATKQGFASPHWMTFKQAKEFGGCVRKGERGTAVVYAKRIELEDEQGEDARSVAFLKRYVVFNSEQVDGIEDKFPVPEPAAPNPDQRNADLDAMFARVNATVRHGGPSAYYDKIEDYVQMPEFEAFFTADDYYSTLAHELCHLTGHEKRLNRETLYGTTRSAYAREELVAELGAAFIGAILGIKVNDREDHAAYLSCWIKALRDDKRAIFTASSRAQAAADYLLQHMDPSESE